MIFFPWNTLNLQRWRERFLLNNAGLWQRVRELSPLPPLSPPCSVPACHSWPDVGPGNSGDSSGVSVAQLGEQGQCHPRGHVGHCWPGHTRSSFGPKLLQGFPSVRSPAGTRVAVPQCATAGGSEDLGSAPSSGMGHLCGTNPRQLCSRGSACAGKEYTPLKWNLKCHFQCHFQYHFPCHFLPFLTKRWSQC